MKPADFRIMVERTMPSKDAKKMEKHVFRIYDSNNDGYIDFIEFMIIFHIMLDGTPEEVLGKIFRVFDANSDGTINKKEMKRLIKDMYGLIKADDPEVQSEALLAKSAFTEMDADGDGKITQAEFISACLGQEELSKMLALKVIDIFVEEDE
jgi:Ca2+-binding EF-hand superfamily protein